MGPFSGPIWPTLYPYGTPFCARGAFLLTVFFLFFFGEKKRGESPFFFFWSNVDFGVFVFFCFLPRERQTKICPHAHTSARGAIHFQEDCALFKLSVKYGYVGRRRQGEGLLVYFFPIQKVVPGQLFFCTFSYVLEKKKSNLPVLFSLFVGFPTPNCTEICE